MRSRTKSSVLWGAVSALVFLVLAQGYELFATLGISLLAKFAIAVVAGIVVAGMSYAFEGWLMRSERS